MAAYLTLDKELIERQPPETRHLLLVVMAFVQQLLARIDELLQTIATRDQTIVVQQAEIQKLKQARKTPRNSSVPPSTEHPHAKPKSSRLPTGKARGGQPGHPKHARELLPIDQCDEVVELVPEVCRRCGAPLDQHQCQFDPLRHQVWEIPEFKPVVIEYSRKRLLCEKCQETTAGTLPADVPTSTAGPKLLATTAMLLSRYRGSRQLTAEALESFFGIPASASWVVNMQTEITSLLRPIDDELVAALPSLGWVNADESPDKECDLKSWLWAVRSEHFTVFANAVKDFAPQDTSPTRQRVRAGEPSAMHSLARRACIAATYVAIKSLTALRVRPATRSQRRSNPIALGSRLHRHRDVRSSQDVLGIQNHPMVLGSPAARLYRIE